MIAKLIKRLFALSTRLGPTPMPPAVTSPKAAVATPAPMPANDYRHRSTSIGIHYGWADVDAATACALYLGLLHAGDRRSHSQDVSILIATLPAAGR